MRADQGPTREARYSAEDLRHMVEHGYFSRCDPMIREMLRQAAEDAEVLERLEAWLNTRLHPSFWSEPKETLWMMNEIANRLKREREDIRHGR